MIGHAVLRHVMDLLLDLLLPKTDLGVLVQIGLLVVLFAVALWRLWSRSELRLLVIGLGLLAFGFVGLRALH